MASMKRVGEGDGGSGGGAGAPRILVVCRGNVRRSPAAAAMLSAGGLTGFAVVSAGTEALVGDGLDQTMAAELRAREIAVPDHRARVLTPREVERADLVLTLERSYRSEVVRMVPSAVRRSFTLRELAALLAELGPESVSGTTPAQRLASMLEQVPGQRAFRQRRHASADDLGDLRRATPRATRELATEIDRSVQPLITALSSTAGREDGQPASQARSSIHHLRSAAANARLQQIKSAR